MLRREGIKRGVYLLPNILTLAGLFCGFFAIGKAFRGDFHAAAWGILIAGIFDGLDGRVARLARAQSDFGIELDSLVDVVSFGVAPAALFFLRDLIWFPRVGFGVAFVFVACGALRLARYNVQFSDEEKRHFQGLPIPIAAYTVAGYVLFSAVPQEKQFFSLFLMFALSLLMVSKVPYHSFKEIGLRHRYSFFVLVALVGIFFIVVAIPNESIFSFAAIYVSYGLLEGLFRSRRRLAGAFQSATQAFWSRLEKHDAEDAEEWDEGETGKREEPAPMAPLRRKWFSSKPLREDADPQDLDSSVQ